MLITTLAGMLAMAAPAAAAITVYNGDTTGAPLFDRPEANDDRPPVQLAVSTPHELYIQMPYQATAFRVDTAGSYRISTTGYDTYLGLYRGGFDPADPLRNALIYNDEGAADYGSGFDYALDRGATYQAVVTGYTNADYGTYALAIDGPGTAMFAPGAPGPLAGAGLLPALAAGTGLVLTRRRRRAASA